MKRFVIAGLVGLSCGLAAAYAAQDTAIDNVEVRDPIRLEAYLEANASDAQSRLAVLEGSLGTNTASAVTVGALTTTGIVSGASMTFGGKVLSRITLTNMIYSAGGVTANVNIVTWTP